MATDQEIYKYIMQVEGEEKIRQAAAAADLAEQKFEAMSKAFGNSAAQTRAAAAAFVDARNKLNDLQKEFAVSSQSMLKFANIIDDLQYVGEQGLRPILNNIVQISPAIGVALIAGQTLYNNFEAIAGLWGGGHTLTEAERMEQLGKKTEKTADEMERLAKYEERRAAIKAQQEGKTEAEQDQSKGVRKAIVEAPYEKARKDAEKLMGDRFRNAAPQELTDEKARADRELKDAQNAQATLNRHTAGKGDERVEAAEQWAGAVQRKLDQDFNDKISAFLADLEDPKNRGQLNAFIGQLKRDRTKLAPGSDEANRADDTIRGLMEAAKTPEQRKGEAELDRKAQRNNDVFDQGEIATKSDKEKAAKEQSDKALRGSARMDDLMAERARLATEMGKGALGRKAGAGKLSDQDVFNEMMKQGMDPDEAFGMHEHVASLIRENGKPERERRKAVGQALKDGSFAGKADVDLTPEEKTAKGLAEDYVAKSRDVDETAQSNALNMARGAALERRNSQVIGSADVANSIQSAVGGPDKQLDRLIDLQKAGNDLQQKILAKIAAQREVQAFVGP